MYIGGLQMLCDDDDSGGETGKAVGAASKYVYTNVH